MNSHIKKFICFILPNDIEQAEYFLGKQNVKFSCKMVSIETEPYNLRKNLKNIYGIETSCLDILDKDKVFIMTPNYDKLKNIPNVEATDEEILEKFKNQLIVYATATLFNLNYELSRAKKITNNVSKKMKLRDRLKIVVEENVFNKNKD